MNYRVFILSILFVALVGCSSHCAQSGACYAAQRTSSLRAADQLGSAAGSFLGGQSSKRTARQVNPYRILSPQYDFYMNRFIDSLLAQ